MSDEYTKVEEEATAKCCLCFPIKCGIQTLSVFTILGAIFKCLGLAGAFSAGVLPIIVGAIWAVVGLYEAWLAITWFRDDNKESRAGLITLFYLQIVDAVISGLFNYFNAQAAIAAMGDMAGAAGSAALGSMIGSMVIGALIAYYYVTVAKRFHSMKDE